MKGLVGFVSAVVVAVGLAGPVSAETLRILAYEGYADKDWEEAFEQETGAEVSVVYAGSPEEMIAKMQGSKGADYDLVAIDTSLIGRYADLGLIQPMDEAKLTRLGNLLPSFAGVPQMRIDGKRHAVPIAWGSLGLIYDRAMFPEPPKSWSVVWDETYRGRVLMGDDGNNNIVNTALMLGIEDPYQLSPEQAAAVKAKLIEVKKNLLAYYSGAEDGVTLFEQNNAALMTAFGELQYAELKKRGVDVGYAVPDEGAVGWVDCWALSSGAKNPDLALRWVDFWLDKKIGAAMSERYGYGNTTNPSDFDYAGRLAWLTAPEDFTMRTNLWNEVKATPAP